MLQYYRQVRILLLRLQRLEKKIQAGKTWLTFKVNFAQDFKETRDSNKTAGNSDDANLVIQMQIDMQTVANKNVQTLANYSSKSDADMNAIETLKEQIVEMKAEQTFANKTITNLTGQVGDTRHNYSRKKIHNENGIIK